MANVDSPQGLVPVKMITGAPYNGQVSTYVIDAGNGTATFVGDLVKQVNTGSDSAGESVYGRDTEGLMHVVQAAAGDAVIGVVVGFSPNQDSLMTKHRAASTARLAYVVDDPNVVFEIQEASGGTALAAADVGLNANVVVGTGNSTTGLSAMELDNSTENTTATLQLKILGMSPRPDNAIGEHCKWLVKINNHQLGSSTGTAGV
jgi:hypothetical protein